MSEKTSSSTDSVLALRTIAMPVFANAHADIFGGWLLSQMDLAGRSGRHCCGHGNDLSPPGIRQKSSSWDTPR
jgi:hypothetical protein